RGYWQQRADYTLQATLDTATNLLRGTGKIYYVNRSPETLDYVWVQLDQNLFAPGSVSNTLNLPPLRFAGGVVFDFSGKGFVGGITIDKFAVAGRALTTKVFGTMMRVELPRPLAPNLSVTFDVAWHFPIPPYGGGRGFAWAAGSGLRWDASVFNGILVQTFYHPDATPWEESNTMLRFAVRHFSGALGEYPWPQISAIEGLVEGMEYPMVIFCPSLQKREDQYWVLMHELGHQWFPMQVGSDERRYPWMDEGFNTFADYDAAEAFFKGTAY